MLASIIISCVSPSVLSNFPELQQLSRVCIGDSNFQGSVHLGWWGAGAVRSGGNQAPGTQWALVKWWLLSFTLDAG